MYCFSTKTISACEMDFFGVLDILQSSKYVSLMYSGYISTSINDGPGCLMLRCPDPSCSAAVGQDMVQELASRDDKEKYNRYFLRSFIEDNRKVIVK